MLSQAENESAKIKMIIVRRDSPFWWGVLIMAVYFEIS